MIKEMERLRDEAKRLGVAEFISIVMDDEVIPLEIKERLYTMSVSFKVKELSK